MYLLCCTYFALITLLATAPRNLHCTTNILQPATCTLQSATELKCNLQCTPSVLNIYYVFVWLKGPIAHKCPLSAFANAIIWGPWGRFACWSIKNECNFPTETTNHKFYECPAVKFFWKGVLKWWNFKRYDDINPSATDFLYGYKPESTC